MPTDADVEKAMVVRTALWIGRADALIEARLEDARSHAWRALTSRVVGASDGRKTYLAVGRTKSFMAAVKRLDELHESLAGAHRLSPKGLLRNARAAFYRGSYPLWDGLIPEELLGRAVHPTATGEHEARMLVIHGRELWDEIQAAIEPAKRSLLAAATQAGSKNATDRQARQLLDVWEQQQARAIRARVRLLISDSDVAIFNAVGRSMIATEYLEE